MTSAIQGDTRSKTINWLFILGILIFTYTFSRACLLSITWDESQSYHEYIKNHIVLLDQYDFMSANSHILNTLGGIIFTEIFGVNEFTLRMTSLIAHLFFLFYSAKLVLGLNNKWIAISAFLILNLNPFLLDFFSLSRGYSVSIGMMMASVYYFHCFYKKDFKSKDALLSLVFSMLATLGNLTLLNYALVLFALIAGSYLYNYRGLGESMGAAIKKSVGKMILPSILFFSFLCFILPISFELRKVGALFMGGDKGLWADTMGTIVPRLWYGLDFSHWLLRLTKLFFLLILGGAGAYVLIKVLKKQMNQDRLFLGSLLLIVLLILLSTVVQHHLLGTLYLIERTVLFLFVLLMLIFVFLISDLCLVAARFALILKISAAFVLLHFLFSFNLSSVFEWKDDCETKKMLADLSRLREQPKDKFNLSIGIPLSLESSINYYRGTDNMNWLNEASRSQRFDNRNDYFFLRPSDIVNFSMDSLEIIRSYPITGNILARSKFPFTKGTVIIDSLQAQASVAEPFVVDPGCEYSPGFRIPVQHEWLIRNSILTCCVEISTLERLKSNVYYVVTCEDKDGVYDWKPLRLNDFCSGYQEEVTANFTTFIPGEMKRGDEIRIYLWNPGKQQFKIKQMHLKWIHYSF